MATARDILAETPKGRAWLDIVDELEAEMKPGEENALAEILAEGVRRFVKAPVGSRVQRNTWTGTKGG
jgi:hypothetical protein